MAPKLFFLSDLFTPAVQPTFRILDILTNPTIQFSNRKKILADVWRIHRFSNTTEALEAEERRGVKADCCSSFSRHHSFGSVASTESAVYENSVIELSSGSRDYQKPSNQWDISLHSPVVNKTKIGSLHILQNQLTYTLGEGAWEIVSLSPVQVMIFIPTSKSSQFIFILAVGFTACKVNETEWISLNRSWR